MYVQLTREQIEEIHDFGLQQHGGLPGEKDPGLISFIVDKLFEAKEEKTDRRSVIEHDPFL
jgi:prophage maintenance system killer protein